MQNGHGNGRNNGLGRNHHTHGHGHHGIKNKDIKLNINGKIAVEPSMIKSEEKERQRQEARALREKCRPASTAPTEGSSAIFAVVQVSPNLDNDRFQISEILGDFTEVSKHHKSTDLIGVDHQPPTPAPSTNAHLHDPDNYNAPPVYSLKALSDCHSYPQRSHNHGAPAGCARAQKQLPTGQSHFKVSHQQKFAEEVKPSLKSGPGPGPGPGPGNRPQYQERGPINNTSGVPPARGRPRSHERAVKDPQVQMIMSEMSDLKSPMSTIHQTPRPDHQSSFTFPAPAVPTDKTSGFRHPHELQAKMAKLGENRSSSSSVTSLKVLESIARDDCQLSEDSDDEVAPSRMPNKSEPGLNGNSLMLQNHNHAFESEGSKEPPISPLKNTDESSNSEDSSGSDSESSSSEEEGKQSPAPASPTPSDKNPWSLSKIFEQKEEFPEVGSKGSADLVNDIRPEPMPPSPHFVEEPAPPVVTTVPSSTPTEKPVEDRTKRDSRQRTLTNSTTTEESSDEDLDRSLKSRRPLGSRTSCRVTKIITPMKVRNMVDPVLSSESEDEIPQKAKPILKNLSQSKSPKTLPPSLAKSRPVARKPQKRKRDAIPPERIKSAECVNSDADSESEDSVDLPNSSSNKCSSKRVAPIKPMVQSSKANLNMIPNGDRPLSQRRSPRKADISTPPSINVAMEDRRKPSYKETKYNEEMKKDDRLEKGAKLPPSAPSITTTQKKIKREEEVKIDKRRRRSRHQNEANVNERGNQGGGAAVNDIQKMEDGRINLASLTRKPNNPCSNSGHSAKVSLPNVVQYENGVPKLMCSIPCNLIDKLPSKVIDNNSSVKGFVKDEKLNKEVLEMRTSGGGKGKAVNKVKNKNSKSPPNEDGTKLKLRAIYSIYKKRPSSLEPDRMKREGRNDGDSQDVKSPHIAAPKLEEIVKQDTKPQIKEDSKSYKSQLDVPLLQRHGSSSSLSSMSAASHPYSKKHKKDKRKDREESSSKEKALESDSMRRKKRTASPEPDRSQKRSRENSRESTRSSKSNNLMQHNTKKQKTSYESENNVLSSPRDNLRETRHSPHPRTSQRNVSEERPMSALSNEATHAPYQSRSKQPLLVSSQDKSIEESHGVNGGDTSEYHSLPSSEHEHASPPLGLAGAPQLLECDQMYPPGINPSPGPSMEYNNSLSLNQEVSNVAPVFISYFERVNPDISKDNTQYLSTAKELKHMADKERHRALQTIMYLEAVLYFILTGDSMESDPNTYGPAYTMYTDTIKLIRHVSSPIFKTLKEGPQNKLNAILSILGLRCQSLLALKNYYMKRSEMKETQRVVFDFLKVNLPPAGRQPSTQQSSTPSATCAGGGTPSGGVWGGSQRSAANNSPSSLSPTPSPAGSVGSEGSQSSSGYSTGETRQRCQPPLMGATPPQGTPISSLPPDVHSMMIKYCQSTYNLGSCHEMWNEADDLVYRHDAKDFFIELDRCMGPLTLHSSLRELVRYVQTALDKLKKLI